MRDPPQNHPRRQTDHTPRPTGNQFIFQFFRGKLHCERIAVLEQYKTPFLEVGEQFADECNEIVRPVTDLLCREQYEAVDWDTSTSTDNFILATSILQEIVDTKIELLINTEVPFSERYHNRPALFVFSANFDPTGQDFGIVKDKKLWSTNVPTLPIFATLYEFIRRYRGILGDETVTSIHHIVRCCEVDADRVPATNPFRKYLE